MHRAKASFSIDFISSRMVLELVLVLNTLVFYPRQYCRFRPSGKTPLGYFLVGDPFPAVIYLLVIKLGLEKWSSASITRSIDFRRRMVKRNVGDGFARCCFGGNKREVSLISQSIAVRIDR